MCLLPTVTQSKFKTARQKFFTYYDHVHFKIGRYSHSLDDDFDPLLSTMYDGGCWKIWWWWEKKFWFETKDIIWTDCIFKWMTIMVVITIMMMTMMMIISSTKEVFWSFLEYISHIIWFISYHKRIRTICTDHFYFVQMIIKNEMLMIITITIMVVVPWEEMWRGRRSTTHWLWSPSGRWFTRGGKEKRKQTKKEKVFFFSFNGCVHGEANFIEVADILSRRAIGKTFLRIGPGKV